MSIFYIYVHIRCLDDSGGLSGMAGQVENLPRVSLTWEAYQVGVCEPDSSLGPEERLGKCGVSLIVA